MRIPFNYCAGLALALLACERPEVPLGRVVVALAEDVCEDYCLVALRATLYTEGDLALPIGPPLQLGCGEEVEFEALPAGERVVVSMQAYDITGELRFDGISEALTIVADGISEARVPLAATAPPAIDEVAPDPVVTASQAAIVTLRGRFGEALGDAGVEVGGVSYEVATWTRSGDDGGDTITLTLPAGAHGGDLVVRQCGVRSAPHELRVVGATLGQADAVTPGCSGAVARAVVADAGEVWVAWSCADGGGSLVAMRQGEALCPLDPGASWVLADAPAGLAVSGERAWIGGAAGIHAVSLASPGGAAEGVSGEPVTAMAATASAIYAIAGGGRLVRVGEAGVSDVSDLEAGLAVSALAPSRGGLFAAAVTTGGDGRLVSVPDGGVVTVRSLAVDSWACRDPSALAADGEGRRVVLACADELLALWTEERQSLQFLSGLEGMEALAFDDRGDVILGLTEGGVALTLGTIEGVVLHRFTLPARPAERPPLLAPIGEQRLAFASAAAPLAVLTPFDTRGPCAEGATP